MKTVGYDIGSHSIKAVSFSKSLLGTALGRMHTEPIGKDGLEAALRRCATAMAEPRAEVVVSFDRRDLAIRFVDLPTRDGATIRKLAPFQLEGKIPFANEALVDGCALAPSGEHGAWSLLMALRRSDFESRMNICRQVFGKEPTYHIDSLAALNVFLSTSSGSEGLQALVDVGHSKTSIAIVERGRLVANRVLLYGISHGTADDDTAVAVQIMANLKRSLVSCGHTEPDLSRIVLVGGGALRTSLTNKLSEILACPVQTMRLDVLGNDTALYATAFALAQSRHQQPAIPLDFFHHERPHHLFNLPNLVLLIGLVLVAASYNVVSLFLHRRALLAKEQLLTNRRLAVERAIEQGPIGVSTNDPALALTQVQRRIALLKRTVISSTRTFLEVSRALGNEPVTLLSFIVKPEFVTIECEADSFSTSDRIKRSLSECSYFSDIQYERVINVGPVSQRKLRFELKFKRIAVSEAQEGE